MKPIDIVKNLNLDEEIHNTDPLKEPIDFWHRIIELTSLARTINPDLPNIIRGYKETSVEDPLSTDFTLYLTKNKSEEFIEISDNDIPLFDALKETLPDYIFNGENNLLRGASPLNFKGPIEAIIYNAYKELAVGIQSKNLSYDDSIDQDEHYSPYNQYKCVYTSPITVPQYYYQNNPHFDRSSFFINSYNKENKEFRILNDKRQLINDVKKILSFDFDTVSPEQKDFIKTAFNNLNGRRFDQTFEDKYNFSFIAYALNYNNGESANSWVNFLVNEVGCDVKAKYGADKKDLLSLAIVRNNDLIIDLLVKNEFPILTVYPEIPDVLDKDSYNNLFRNFQDSYMPSLVLAAIWGSDKVAEKLLENSAYVDSKTTSFRTAAHYAAFNNDSKLLTLLVSHGADLNIEDCYKAIPAERVPNTEEGNILYNQLEEWRLNKLPKPKIENFDNKKETILLDKNILKEKLKTQPKSIKNKNNIK